MPGDEREQQMLDLMQEAIDYIVAAKTTISNCLYEVNKMQNTINEIWAEWTRTHGLRGIRDPAPRPHEEKAVVRRVVRK